MSSCLLSLESHTPTHNTSTVTHNTVTVENCTPTSHVASQPTISAVTIPRTSITCHPCFPQPADPNLAPFASVPSSNPIRTQSSDNNNIFMLCTSYDPGSIVSSTSRNSVVPSPTSCQKFNPDFTSTCWKMPNSAKS